ncbi:mCG49740, partial [Mus musculus]
GAGKAAEPGGGALWAKTCPGLRPARRASWEHRHHAQERKAAQVPGPRRLLGPIDRGGLCQLGSSGGKVWTGQESRGQSYSAGSKISVAWKRPRFLRRRLFPGWVSRVTSWTAVMRWMSRKKALRKNQSPEKRRARDTKKTRMALEKSILWIFGCCWLPISVLRTL